MMHNDSNSNKAKVICYNFETAINCLLDKKTGTSNLILGLYPVDLIHCKLFSQYL